MTLAKTAYIQNQLINQACFHNGTFIFNTFYLVRKSALWFHLQCFSFPSMEFLNLYKLQETNRVYRPFTKYSWESKWIRWRVRGVRGSPESCLSNQTSSLVQYLSPCLWEGEPLLLYSDHLMSHQLWGGTGELPAILTTWGNSCCGSLPIAIYVNANHLRGTIWGGGEGVLGWLYYIDWV